jgi:hypothetical protein
MADAVVPYLGWGSLSQAWNTGTWNTDTNSIIPVATGAVTVPTITGDANFTITTTDIVGTGSPGSAALTGTATVTATGIAGTGGLSAVTITGDANFTITTTDIVGLGAVNGVTVTGDANIPIDVTGSGAVGIVGVGFVWGLNVPNQDPNWKEIAA